MEKLWKTLPEMALNDLPPKVESRLCKKEYILIEQDCFCLSAVGRQ